MLDNICQAYHWPLHEAMSLTMPQIIMLGHASKVNHLRLQEKIERDRVVAEQEREKDRKDPRMGSGKRMSEMTMDELLPVMMGGSSEE
jgi:hypothetical protein